MKLSHEELNFVLKDLDKWYIENNSLKKRFYTKGFAQTLGYVTSIGALCQQFDHHPDYLTLKYQEIEVSFSTHTEGGITEKDVNIAKQIEKLFV